MKVSCPACKHVLVGRKSAMGTRVGCPACKHSFFWTDCHHTGETFVVYDLETTGLDPEHDEFIQIAAMRFSAGCLCREETFASFAKPRQSISSFIESYTGIGNRHVKDAARPEEVLLKFAAWSGDSTLIAHNGLRFDSKFLAATCRRHGLPMREVQSIDSIHMSKMLFGKTRGDAVMLRPHRPRCIWNRALTAALGAFISPLVGASRWSVNPRASREASRRSPDGRFLKERPATIERTLRR